MTQLCLLLPMALLLTTSRCDICDPDIPSRSLKQDIQNDMAGPGSASAEPGKCDPGHYRDRASDECKSCPAETFVTKQMSELKGYWSCETCLKPETHLEEVTAAPCNTTRDTTILCQDGYFRDQTNPNRCDWSCKKCTLCEIGTSLGKYLVQPCGNYSDTICCKYDDMETINGTCVSKFTENGHDINTTNAGLDVTPGNRYTTHVIFMVIFICVCL
ncbi:unnamed protein product [Lymnaea stagnalis]|uniref:TNFR-Cys domain-containing protein n=1 Tax=Lymnaea stagnalis TaxID=6523 RepID=A0AAV2HX25_LYMST